MNRALLPPVLPRWPVVLWAGDRPHGEPVDAALGRIRREGLFWPACRLAARRPRALVMGPAWRTAARAAYAEADIAETTDPSAIDPERLEAVFGPPGPVVDHARLGGLLAEGGAEPAVALATARGVCPWSGRPLGLDEAIEAQALLRGAAMAARGPVRLVGMTRWKRRNLAPFLTGPDGPPVRGAGPGPAVVWGSANEAGALQVEDGFLRSVGLGLRHTPPLSLVIDRAPPHFDATRPNGFEAAVAAADFTPALLARARRLREAVVALGLTKYNLGGAEPLPDTRGREAVLVPGQVARDASIRLGARAVRTDADLLAAARARFPGAFLLYKPHPDVVTGLRRGAAASDARRLADATVLHADAAACLGWADRVATITSLMGFEALLRGKAVTCFGRPFYGGWGLTDDTDPAPGRRPLALDALVAAALILYPRYIDPRTRLPCPPEVALAALVRERAEAGLPVARLRRAWRDAVSWVLNWPGR